MAEAVAGIALEKAAGSLFDEAKEKIGYMWNCKENVQKLEEEVERLKLMKSQVQQQIDNDKPKGDDLIKGVEEWVEKAGQEISEAEKFLGEFQNAKKTCFKIGMCGNWSTLYHYGKRATEMMTPLKDHKSDGKDFVTCVYVETPPPTQLDVYQTKNPEDLVTHNSALNAIIAALQDETKQIIGIYGIGGVGKTTLAMEVAAKVKHLFADVAFTTVSQTVKTKEIKKDIGNATKRIAKGEKVLIILDDVWKKLDLEELCIPINRTNCRILLTSRNEDVCKKMNAKSKIRVDSLQPKEAWILFTRVVGESVETDADLKPVAEEVAKECGGLPLLIKAVGNALKSKSISSWKDALSQLKKHAPSDIDPDIGEAFTRLQLSYRYLESEKAKSCFLLCSMFPEDRNISLEDLVFYMVGLEKFDGLDSMEDARVKVRNAVNMLISSCLLLNSEWGEGYTKMHDVVRDVALLIASQGKNKYLVEAGKGEREWLPRNKSLESYTGISLMHNNISKLPDYEVQLSSLDILLVNHNAELSMISDKFIEGMKEVKVLDMKYCDITHLPQSLKLLTKLRMLNLEKNFSLDDISLLGEMKELEILLLDYTGIKEIPKEIGRLVNLRRLEVSGCRYMTRVTPGVISKLRSLEELCIDFSKMSKGVYECLVEVMKLSKLTYLKLVVNSFNLIPEGFNSENLKGFDILIGEICYLKFLRRSDRRVTISGEHLLTPLLKWLKKLIEVSRPHIYLSYIKNLNNIMPDLYHEGFNKLEDIGINGCSNVSCLVNDDGTIRCDGDEGETSEKYFMELKHLYLRMLNNLEVLWKCPDEYISFTKLVTLSIFNCNKLERVFTWSVAQGLVNLKNLDIENCVGLKEVIYGGGDGGDDESGNIIVFRSLAQIYLRDLERLKSFHSGGSENCSIKYPSLVDVQIHDCKSMKIWGTGIHETPKLKSILFGTSNKNKNKQREPLSRILLVTSSDKEQIVQLDGANAINDALAKKLKQLLEEVVEDDEE